MGYTIYYEGKSDAPITDTERALVEKNAATCTESLSETAEPFTWTIDETGRKLEGATKPGLGDDTGDDIDMMIAAVEQLSEALPNFAFTATDDFGNDLFPYDE